LGESKDHGRQLPNLISINMISSGDLISSRDLIIKMTIKESQRSRCVEIIAELGEVSGEARRKSQWS